MVDTLSTFDKTGGDAAAEALEAGKAAGAECLAAALEYLALGWSTLAVCPPDHVGVGKTHAQNCKHPGKAPWGTWKEYQTRLPTDAELCRKWHDNPLLNAGVALGGVTGLIGLDIDGRVGEEVLARLSGGDVPRTLEFTSGAPDSRRLLYRVPVGAHLRPTPRPGGLEVEHGELRLLGLGSQRSCRRAGTTADAATPGCPATARGRSSRPWPRAGWSS
jgi:hypothetical protein